MRVFAYIYGFLRCSVTARELSAPVQFDQLQSFIGVHHIRCAAAAAVAAAAPLLHNNTRHDNRAVRPVPFAAPTPLQPPTASRDIATAPPPHHPHRTVPVPLSVYEEPARLYTDDI